MEDWVSFAIVVVGGTVGLLVHDVIRLRRIIIDVKSLLPKWALASRNLHTDREFTRKMMLTMRRELDDALKGELA
jgi:hypothetical protein